MADSYTTVKRTSWLGNIIGSFVGAGAGVIVFLVALGLIWFGEGRTNMALVAQDSLPAPAERVDPANAGRLVSVTGTMGAAPLGDGKFLDPGPYLRLERRVEMYAWVEEKRTERQDEVGGGTTERTTYSYSTQWTASPESGEGFYRPSGHRNPSLPFSGSTLSADDGRIGAYAVNLVTLDMPSPQDLALTPAMVRPDDRWQLVDRFIFIGDGSLGNPALGDVRVSYLAVPAGLQATVFGEQRGAGIEMYRTPQGDELYRALPYDRAGAIKYLSNEDTFIDWIIRLGALLMLWVGLLLVLGPINALVGFLPALKQASGCLTALLAFVPAFIVWVVAEVIAIVAHNIWLLLGAVLLALAGAIFAGRRFLPARSEPAV
jgi:hypothetical protein